jgi:hypothetical protein
VSSSESEEMKERRSRRPPADQPRGLNFEELVHPSARGLSVLFESRLQHLVTT